MCNYDRMAGSRSRRGRPTNVQVNSPENVPAPQPDRLEITLQAIQQQNALILQALQNGQIPPIPPMPQTPAERNEERVASVQPSVGEPRNNEKCNEPAIEVQGPPRCNHELPPEPLRSLLPKFIKCNRYFEGLPGKPEEAED